MEQLVDSIIVDCNEAVRALTQGQYILFCRLMYQMVQKLGNLKKGIADYMHNREKTIEDPKKHLHKVDADTCHEGE